MGIKNQSKKLNTVDITFWICLILFSNPGGILNLVMKGGGVDVTDALFFVMLACYLFLEQSKQIFLDRKFKKIFLLILLSVLYHFLFFNFFIPHLKGSSFEGDLFVLIKSRRDIYSIFLLLFSYSFLLRNCNLFLKIFLISSIIILFIFIFSLVAGIEILPIRKLNRGYSSVERLLLFDYGFMPLLIPMGAIYLIFKINLSQKRLILTGSFLMLITWVLSISRRHIIGSFIYFLLGTIIYNFINHKPIIPVGKFLKSLVYFFIVIGVMQLVFPKYVEAGYDSIYETVYVIRHGESTTGKKDVRLGFGKEKLQRIIIDNLYVGTGFDNRWRTGAGSSDGYEASDYPFLSAIAMKGLLGLLIFFPVYVVLVNTIIYDIKFLRHSEINFNSLEFLLVMTFILYFIYDLFQYMNWFLPIARMRAYEWYVYLGFYMAARALFYSKLNTNSNDSFYYP